MGKMNDIRFTKTNGGMGRKTANEDPVSALLMALPELDIQSLLEEELQAISAEIGTTIAGVGEGTPSTETDDNTPLSLPDEYNSLSDYAERLVFMSNENGHPFDGITEYGGAELDAPLYMAKLRYPEDLASLGIGAFVEKDLSTLDEGVVSPYAYRIQSAVNAVVYHVKEFFRMNPEGTLYLGITTGAQVLPEHIEIVQNYTGGTIRQAGVLTGAGDGDYLGDYQEICAKLEREHMPLSLIVTTSGCEVRVTGYEESGSSEVHGDLAAVLEGSESEPGSSLGGTTPATDTATETEEPHELYITVTRDIELSALTGASAAVAGRCNVSFLVGCELDGLRVQKLGTYGYYGCIGTCLGAVSKAAVHESIAWVQKFPLGLKAPGLICDQLISEVSTGDQEAINDNRYIFVRTYVGNAGNYFNDSHTLDVATSDYAYIENMRTMDKACRGVRANLLPQLNSPLKVDTETGQLDPATVAFLETTAGKALEDMEKADELSGYRAEIDPEQNVLATSEVEVIVKNVPMGVMRKVHVKIGFTTSLS